MARDTRHGCPLLLLLFALAIEPLAAQLRADREVKGGWINTMEEKTSLYADDILLYLAEGSLVTALNRITGFGKYSGF